MSDWVNPNNRRLPLPAENPEAERSDTSPESASSPSSPPSISPAEDPEAEKSNSSPESASPRASPPSISPSPNTLLANRNRLRLLAQPGPSATGGADPALAAAAPGHHPSPPVAALAYLLASAMTSRKAIEDLAATKLNMRAVSVSEDLAATKLNMRAVSVEPDGNCLFRALAVATGMDEDDHPTVRYRAVEAAGDFYDLAQLQASSSDGTKPFETVGDYYAQMLRPAKGKETGWGGHTEMAAFADMQGIRLVVHDLVGGILPQQFGPENGPPHHIGRLTPNHFVALFPRQHQAAPPADQAAVPASEAALPASEATPPPDQAPILPDRLSALPAEILSNVIDHLETGGSVKSSNALGATSRAFLNAVRSPRFEPGASQTQALSQTIGDLEQRFATAWNAGDEKTLAALLQPMLERTKFLPRSGLEPLVEALIAPDVPRQGQQIRTLKIITQRLANASLPDKTSLSDLEHLSTALVTEAVRHPSQHWPSLGHFLQDTSNLSPDQVTSLIDAAFPVHNNIGIGNYGRQNMLNSTGVDMTDLDHDQRERVMQVLQSESAQPGNNFLRSSALASIATYPDPSVRAELHQRLFATTPHIEDLVSHALSIAARASARFVQQLLDHLTTTLPASDTDHVLRNGAALGDKLTFGVSSGRAGTVATLTDFATGANLPPAEITHMFNGGALSTTPLHQTPLTAAIGTGSINQVNELKEGLRRSGLPPVSVEAILAQTSRGGNSQRSGMAAFEYLMSQDAPCIARPALAAYGDLIHDLLDAPAQTRLLSARGNSGSPPLYSAILNSKTDLVRTCGQMLATLSLPPPDLQTIVTLTDRRGSHILNNPDLHDVPSGVKALVDLAQSLNLPEDTLRSVLNFTPDANGRYISTGIAGSHTGSNPLVWRQPSPSHPDDSPGVAALKTALNALYTALDQV